MKLYIAHFPQQFHNSKFVIFQQKSLKILKCYNFLWLQRRHTCSPAASFANCVMTLYLLKGHLQTCLSIPVIQKCQILSCDTFVANEWNVLRPTQIYILMLFHYSANVTICYIHIYIYTYTYTGCPRRNVKYFGRVFLMLNYNDITEKTYIPSWMVTEIMAREVWNFDSCYTLIDYQINIENGRNMWFP